MKKLIALLTVVSVCLLTGCFEDEAKFVGSRDTEGYSCDIEIYESVDNLFEDSELVVVGVAGKPQEVTEEFLGEVLYASEIPVFIKLVLKGDLSDNSLNVLQTGKPTSDDYETKLDEGGEYILFLNSKLFNGKTVYDCTGIEQGIFEIDEKGNLYAYADFGISAAYDNKSADLLKEKSGIS